MNDAPGPERWPRAVWRAFWHALWVVTLVLTALVASFLWSNWRSGDELGELGKCAAFAAGLIGLPIAYRRQIPRAVRWPETKRAWLLTIPLFAALGLVAFLIIANGLRGALRG